MTETWRKDAENCLSTSRVLDAPRELVYRVITTPEHLVRWFGPAGFSCSYTVCDVRPGGQWLMTLHAPDGTEYYNEWEFGELSLDRIVMIHLRPMHRFVLTITLVALDARTTRLDWEQCFETAGDCNKVRSYAAPANEQNLDKLASLLHELLHKRNTGEDNA